MYLRETQRTNRDGSVVAYLQLAHNERHPETGNSVAEGDPQLRSGGAGRSAGTDSAGVVDLAVSASEQAMSAAAGADVEVLDSRHLDGAWTLDRVWERLLIGAAIRRVATGRRLDGEAVEQVVYALVAQRALEPGSKLAGIP